MTISRIIFTLPLLVLIIGFANLSESNENDAMISDKDDAISLALEFTGFDRLQGFQLKNSLDGASMVTFNDDKIPFLSKKVYGQKVWEVIFSDICFKNEARPLSLDSLNRKYYVYLDPSNRKLIKIHSPFLGEEKEKKYLPAPTVERAEKELSGMFLIFRDFENINNYVPFLEAIKSYYYYDAQEITANLTSITLRGKDHVIWSVTFRGIEPRRNRENVADKYENYVRVEYSAENGEVLAKSSIPTVEPIENMDR